MFTLCVPLVLPVADIFCYFGGAVGNLFLVLFLLHVSEKRSWREATRFLGEDAGSPGCQHPQPDQNPQRQLLIAAVGPRDHQRRLAGLSEVEHSPSALTCMTGCL